MESEVLKQVPETRLALPFILQTASIDFRGELPRDGQTITEWRFDIVSKDGVKYGADVKVDPAQTPWNIALTCSPFEIPVERLAVWSQSNWAPDLPEGGTCRLLKLNGYGRWGAWDSWNVETKIALQAPSLTIPEFGREFKGTDLILDAAGNLDNAKGTLSLTIEEIPYPPLTKPVQGFRARDLDFAYSLSRNEWKVSGPWSVQSAPGGAYAGTLSVSSAEGYRLRAENKDVEWTDWEVPLTGTWAGVVNLSGNPFSESPPSVEMDLTGSDVFLGGVDFSRRDVQVHLEGKANFGAGPSFDLFTFAWGQAFQVTMRDFYWDSQRFKANLATLTGDLLVLSEFFPGVSVNPRVGKWINPKEWKVTGGFEVIHKPNLEIRTQEATLDTGRGQGGPFSFSYSDSSKTWSFESPTLQMGLDDLVREMAIPGVQAQGAVQVSANLTGRIPSARLGQSGSLVTAMVRANLTDSIGLYSRPDRHSGQVEPILGWDGLQGSFEVDWSSASRRIQTRLSSRDLIWYTKSPATPAASYPQSLSTNGASLSLTAVRGAPGDYHVDEFIFRQGEDSPVVMTLTGPVQKRGSFWTPDFKVRIAGDRAQVTPVFRGWQLGGTGTFLGTVKGDNQGKWVLNGEVDCRNAFFEFVVGPAQMEGIEGTFYFRDVLLDEAIGYNRWIKRNVGEPPTQPDSLTRAFEGGGVEPNIRAKSAQFGEMRLSNLTGATFLRRDAIYVNRLEGHFAQGGHPLRMTGFVFFQPGVGVGWRMRAGTSRVPMVVAIPGIGDVGLDYDAIDVDIYSTKNPGTEFIETRHLMLGVPIGQLKNIPGIGETLFGWTPDVLGSRTLIIRRVGHGPWETLNPLSPADVIHLPNFFLQNLPDGVLDQMQQKGTQFFRGIGSGFRDTFFPE